MSTIINISKGGRGQNGQERNNRHLLLVGSQGSGAAEIGLKLGIVREPRYATSFCSGYEEAKDFLLSTDAKIDVIIVDLSIFNANYPKEYFLQIKAGIPDIPIIVLTDRTDYDLISFVMEAGAADNISQWQLHSDPDRLRNVIESCISRDKISRRAKAESGSNLAKARTSHDSALTAVNLKIAASIQGLRDENVHLHERTLQAETDTNSAKETGMANLRQAKITSDTVLKLSQVEAAENLQASHDDKARLQVDNDKLLFDLSASRDRGIADLKDASDRHDGDMQNAQSQNDAILKYAQDKSAIDLKKVEDENKTLSQYNSYAREWLSGSYAGSPDTPPAKEQDDNEKMLN